MLICMTKQGPVNCVRVSKGALMAYLWALRIPIGAFNDGREADPFLPVRQHDAAIIGSQLQG